MIASFDELIEAAVAVGPKRVAVAAANERETLAALIQARRMGVAEPVLVGNREWIELVCALLSQFAKVLLASRVFSNWIFPSSMLVDSLAARAPCWW